VLVAHHPGLSAGNDFLMTAVDPAHRVPLAVFPDRPELQDERNERASVAAIAVAVFVIRAVAFRVVGRRRQHVYLVRDVGRVRRLGRYQTEPGMRCHRQYRVT
jgi:hypothetical protein